MAAGERVASDEELGRSIASGRSARRAARGGFRYFDFLPPRGALAVSTDRLTVAPAHEALAIAERRERLRTPSRTFYGWAVVTAGAAARNGRRVTASPVPDNPWHADIVFPEAALENDALSSAPRSGVGG